MCFTLFSRQKNDWFLQKRAWNTMIYHEFPHWNRNPLGQRELRQFLPFFPAKSAWQVVEIALRQRRQLAPVASPKRPRESRHCFTCHGYTGKNIGIQLFSSIWDGNYLVSQEKNVEFYPISQELNTQDILECIVFFRKIGDGIKNTLWHCMVMRLTTDFMDSMASMIYLMFGVLYDRSTNNQTSPMNHQIHIYI